jgi:uncharacterized protein (DUF362 family)
MNGKEGREMNDKDLTRRDFLKAAAAAGAFLAAGPSPAVRAIRAADEQPAATAKDRSRVVVARSDEIRTSETELRTEKIKQVLDEAVRRLADKRSARAAWEGLFGRDEKVTIKVGCLPGERLSTRPEVVQAIVDGVLSAGVKPGNIIVWDRSDRELVSAGFEIRDDANAVKCFGTDHLPAYRSYTREIEYAGDVGSFMSRILSDLTDALISVPVLKDHDLSGVSLSMKNFFGAIHNPNKYHLNRCDPYIGQLMTHRFIRDRLRLVVIDGSLAQSQGGPAYSPKFAWPWNGLIVARDPVAADATGAAIIEADRKARSLPSLEAAGRPPLHIETAQKLGVGFADGQRIERVEI